MLLIIKERGTSNTLSTEVVPAYSSPCSFFIGRLFRTGSARRGATCGNRTDKVVVYSRCGKAEVWEPGDERVSRPVLRGPLEISPRPTCHALWNSSAGRPAARSSSPTPRRYFLTRRERQDSLGRWLLKRAASNRFYVSVRLRTRRTHDRTTFGFNSEIMFKII
jgi:hypothetical protein